jgi:ABC-type Na+ efflux pump permease subunit
MWKRWGIGPVFAYESLLNARRWQVYAGRSLFVLVMLIGMMVVWLIRDQAAAPPFGPAPPPGRSALPTYKQMAKLGEWFFYAVAGTQLSLVMLLAPAAAASSVCMDRARGTLVHMLVTDLSDREIVLGKLGSRLAPVFGLIACAVPVACLTALLGGVEFEAIVECFVVSVCLAVLGCALALTISVWAPKAHEVLMAVYMIFGFWLMSLPIWEGMASGGKIPGPPIWFVKTNPYVLVLAPYAKPGFVDIADFAVFGGIAFGPAAALLLLSIARIRKVVIEHSGRQVKERRSRLAELKRFFPSWPAPQLDGNPVLWREWTRSRPSRFARRLWAILFVVIWGSMGWGTYESILEGTSQGAFRFGFMMLVMFGLLMLSATAPTALAEERVLGSLDVLLSTPLSTRAIVAAKWWGMFRRVLVLALVPLYGSFFIAASVPDIPIYAFGVRFAETPVRLTGADRVIGATLCVFDFLVSGALIVSWGLALATWVPRLSRAIAGSVIAFLLFGMGWPLMIELLFSPILRAQLPGAYERNRWLQDFLTSLSPLAGPMNPLRLIEQCEFRPRWPFWLAIGLATLIKAGIAGLLFRLTSKSFDRCLGRMQERVKVRRPRERAVPEELIPAEVS